MGTAEPAASPVDGSATPLAVLILEDRAADAELMLHELQRGRFVPSAVRVAEEGEFVRELSQPYDVVLADYALPGFDALRALDLLLERGIDVPVIVVSGSLSDEQALECIAHGAADYLLKDRLGRLPFAVRRALLDREVQRRAEEQRTVLQREQAARAMAERERDRLQQVIDALPVGVALADASGAIVLSNAAARAIWGGEARDMRGLRDYQKVGGLKRADGSDYAPEEFPLVRSLLQAETVHGEQLLVQGPGADRWVPMLVNSAPLRGDDGSVSGGVVVFQDISPLKDLEVQKDEFLAAASHDLKNPLTALIAQAQLVRRRVATGSIDTQRLAEALERIESSAARIAAMIDELMDITRQQMGLRLELNLAPLDLLVLARRVVDEQQRATERHELQLEPSSASIEGMWDELRLERVLSNLVSNAIKYSPAGGLVRVGLDAEPDVVTISVEDHGVGIPPEALPHVFQRFYRADNVARRFPGNGIGLGSVLQIVKAHGGSIDVHSQEGTGSTFIVRLPRTPAA